MALTATEEKAMAILRERGPLIVAEFGAAMGYRQRPGPRNNLTGARVLSRLREKGYVSHESDPSRRGQFVWRVK